MMKWRAGYACSGRDLAGGEAFRDYEPVFTSRKRFRTDQGGGSGFEVPMDGKKVIERRGVG